MLKLSSVARRLAGIVSLLLCGQCLLYPEISVAPTFSFGLIIALVMGEKA
jgi:hypothetical protein